MSIHVAEASGRHVVGWSERVRALHRRAVKVKTSYNLSEILTSHSEISASEAADAELRSTHAKAALIRKQHQRRLVERGSRAEHSGWMKRRLQRPSDGRGARRNRKQR